jgi:hypothetical protein
MIGLICGRNLFWMIIKLLTVHDSSYLLHICVCHCYIPVHNFVSKLSMMWFNMMKREKEVDGSHPLVFMGTWDGVYAIL